MRLFLKIMLISTFCLVNIEIARAENEFKPSFDCEKAKTEVEKLICSDAELARSDRNIAADFSLLKEIVPKIAIKSQKEWLKKRNTFITTSLRQNCTQNVVKIRSALLNEDNCLAYHLGLFMKEREFEIRDLAQAYRKTYRNFLTNSVGVILYDFYEDKNFTKEEQNDVCTYVKKEFFENSTLKDLNFINAQEANIDISELKKIENNYNGEKFSYFRIAEPSFTFVDYDNDGVKNLIFKKIYIDSRCNKSYFQEYDKNKNKINNIIFGKWGNDNIMVASELPCKNGDMSFFYYNGIVYQANSTVVNKSIKKPVYIFKFEKNSNMNPLCYYPILP